MQASGRFGSGRSTRGRSAVISSWPPVLDDPYNIHIARTLTQAFCDTDLQIADKFVKSKKVRSVCVRVRACVLRARVRCGLPRRLGGLAPHGFGTPTRRAQKMPGIYTSPSIGPLPNFTNAAARQDVRLLVIVLQKLGAKHCYSFSNAPR